MLQWRRSGPFWTPSHEAALVLLAVLAALRWLPDSLTTSPRTRARMFNHRHRRMYGRVEPA